MGSVPMVQRRAHTITWQPFKLGAYIQLHCRCHRIGYQRRHA